MYLFIDLPGNRNSYKCVEKIIKQKDDMFNRIGIFGL